MRIQVNVLFFFSYFVIMIAPVTLGALLVVMFCSKVGRGVAICLMS